MIGGDQNFTQTQTDTDTDTQTHRHTDTQTHTHTHTHRHTPAAHFTSLFFFKKETRQKIDNFVFVLLVSKVSLWLCMMDAVL